MSDVKTEATVTTPEATAAEPERTFTQAEMDAIIGDRLKRERAKYSDYDDLKAKAAQFDAVEEANKSDLQKATEKAEALQAQLDAMTAAAKERELRERIAEETGVPASVLRGNSEEDLRAHAEAIKGFAKAGAYPSVKDGGETKVSSVTKEEILAIKDERQRLKAIEENISLFE